MSDINITVNDEIVNIDVIDTPVYVEVTNSPGPAGAGVAAGGTTGQVLSKASNTNYDTVWVNPSTGGVPYSGATGDVSLGEYGINVGNVIYDTTPTGIPTEQGATYWDTDAETVALIMNGTIQKIGEDTFYHVRNTTGSTIAKGTAVRFSGTTGNSGRLLIAPMLADGTYPSQYYMGITSDAIANNADGKVYHFGKMRNVNTSAFADGDVLYVSPSVAGALTATAPVAPNNIIVAAAVVHAANNGTLMIRTTLASNINSDEGVLLTTPTANQGLFYDSGLWVNKSITTALGYTPVPTTRTITINGVSYDLSADRSYTVAGGISGSGASGQVAYWSGSSAVSGSSAFLWDNTNSRLAIGTSTTWQAGIGTLSVVNGTTDAPILSLKNTDASKQVYYASYNDVNKNLSYIVYGSTAAGTIFGQNRANAVVVLGYNTPSVFAIGNFENVPLIFGNNNQERFRVTTSGNVSIGTTSDLGTRLGVIGDTLLRGSGATSATTALTVQNSSSTNLFTVRNDGVSIVTGILNITGSITAASTIARGQYIDNTLIASANNDILSGLDIRPTFNIGAFTGVGRFGIRIVSSTGVICYAVNMIDGSHIFGDASGNARLGINSTGGGSSSIAIANPGGTNSASGPSAISIGTNTAGGQNTISIGGSNTNAGEYNIAIGTNQTCNGTSSIVIGRSRTSHNFCIALGHGNSGVGTTATNQFIAATITEVYFGNGVRPFSGNATSYLISGSGGSGNDTNGGNVTIGGGRGTGIGTPGDVIFSTTNLQTTGGTEQTRVDRWWVKGATGQFANVASPNASAIMQANSTTKGFLPPRMTTTEKNAIATPAAGLVVYDTTLNKLCVYTTAWETITSV